MTTAKLRFAPSPTGFLHLGNARMAVFNYLYAKQLKGEYLLRIDDTDLNRVKDEYIVALKEDLSWLGLTWEHEFRQSDRLAFYNEMLQKLITEGKVYPCYETPEELDYKKKMLLAKGKAPIYDRAMMNLPQKELANYQKEGRKPHYRLAIDYSTITWEDKIKGHISFLGNNISDPILVRADGTFLYILTSVLDDIDSQITHIIRGEDHITNTAIQIQLFQYLKSTIPTFAHLPLITTMQGEGFSKRNASLSLRNLKKQAIQPMAINNYLYNLGLGEQNIVYESLEDITKVFSLEKYSTATAKFDEAKLYKLNLHWLQNMENNKLIALVKNLLNIEITNNFWEHIKHNIKTFQDITVWYNICYGEITTSSNNKELLQVALANLPQDTWQENTWQQWLEAIKTHSNLKNKEIFKPLRMAISGMEEGPELKELILLIGKEKIITRLQKILDA
ncbi:Glutamate--tRNA ligase 1 [Candidatus Hepatincola sp. Pdp]